MKHDAIALALKAGMSTAEAGIETKKQRNTPVANGDHSRGPWKKSYSCSECGASMTKRGAGLGHWVCSKNSTHTKAKASRIAA